MKHPMVRITPSESILAQSKFKEKALERIFNFISTNYKMVNTYFGIEQNVSGVASGKCGFTTLRSLPRLITRF
ncbi:hypothetical protein MXE24_18045 [Bacillus cytotoxicus]|uniref:hypothetical protein n=1 Tax=Bacillus cytotoxicus TaxID=580165 RepID=UPI002447E953|nr:hypothetical protein [Bacillus cytotoxicus]MDH2878225.1 hypothetical protein [Bacillus cytotoxicus]MDH2922959.1 hypothetical protein [Bacillus cytotoxicus]